MLKPKPPAPWHSALLMLGLCSPLAAEPLTVGMPAPGFTLPDATGTPHRLEDHAGHWLVLYFYPKDDTPGCTTEACSFRDELEIVHRLNAQVVGVSVDDPSSHQQFIEKYGLPFPLLSDTDGQVADQYGARGGFLGFVFAKRHTFLIDPKGVIQHIWRDVKPSEHTQEVIAALKGVQGAE